MKKCYLVLVLFTGCLQFDEQQGPLTFFVIGDWGHMGNPEQQVVSMQMNEWAQKERPDFIVSTGDNFYFVGVQNLEDPHWQSSFEQVYAGRFLRNVPWYVTLGNHDYLGQPQVEVQYSAESERWKLPSNYHTTLIPIPHGGNLRLIFIDTSPLERSYYSSPGMAEKVSTQDTTRQLRWLDSLTSLTDAQWKIVFGHHPVYTGGRHRVDPNSVRSLVEPIFKRNKVDIYFCGHDHDLQYIRKADQVTSYFISGAGSATTPVTKIEGTQFAESQLGFVTVTLLAGKLTVKFVNYKGQVLYETTFNKP